MPIPNKNNYSRYFSVSCFLLALYGFLTTLFSAWVMGYVHDEPMFLTLGQFHLSANHHFAESTGHPPFSQWAGALLPTLLGHRNTFDPITLFEARFFHILIYVFCGITISWLLRQRANAATAFLFSAFYFTLIPLKAIVSHHVIDSDCSVLAVTTGVLLWNITPIKFLRKIKAFLPLSFALMCKLTAFIFVPFFILNTWLKEKNFRSLIPALIAFIISLCVAYLFQFEKMVHYAQVFSHQLHHNQGGHLTTLFQTFYPRGVYFFYAAVFLLKTSLPTVAFIFFGAVIGLRKERRLEVWNLFFFPALALAVLLSLAHVQLGYRYFLPSVVSWVVFAAIVLGRHFKESHIATAISVALVFLLFSDFNALAYDSYLSYFNFLAPRPTLNFSDSNIDWGQRIPRHLKGSVPKALEVKDAVAFLKGEQGERSTFMVGATELNGIWLHPLGPMLRAFSPIRSVAGYDFFELSQQDLFHLLLERPPLHTYGSNGLKTLSKPFISSKSGKLVVETLSKEIHLKEKIQSIPPKEKILDLEIEGHWISGRTYLILVDSNEGVDFAIGDQKMDYDRKPNEHQFTVDWLPFVAPGKKGEHVAIPLHLKYEIRYNSPPESRRIEVLAISEEAT